MPYIIKKTKEKGKIGYKVCKRDEPERCFSKHPMSEKKARKQRTAIILSELGRSRPRGGMDGQPGNTANADNEEENETTPPATGTPQEPPGAPRRSRPVAQIGPSQPRMAMGARRALFTDMIQTETQTGPSSPPRGQAGPSSPPRAGPSSPPRAGPSSPPRAGPSSPPRAGPSSPPRAGPSSSNGYTREICEEFLKNPSKNPLTKKNIKRYTDTFHKIVDNCMIVMGKDFLYGLEKISVPFKKEFLDEIKEKHEHLISPEERKKKEEAEKKKEEEMCEKFVKNQTRDPKNNSKIGIPSKKHIDLYNKCQKKLPEDLFKILEKQFIESTIPQNIHGANMCKHMINDVELKAVYNTHNRIERVDTQNISNPYNMERDVPYRLPFDHPLTPLLLEKCENNFLMQIIVIKLISRNEFKDYFEKIKYSVLSKGNNQRDFTVSYDLDNITSIIRKIAQYIIVIGNYRYNDQKRLEMLKDLQVIVHDLINKSSSNEGEIKNGRKIFILEETRKDLQSCLFEIEALLEGIDMRQENSSASSDIEEGARAAWRSKSLDIPEGLPVLPTRTRDEILKELGKVCRDMMDMISLEEFKKMKRKKLELVVNIGPKNAEGKQTCYYVKNIFDSITSNVIHKNPITEPLTKVPITKEEIENIILPKMKYIDIDVINPLTKQLEKQLSKIPNIKILLVQVIDNRGRHFYKVGYERTLGSYKERIDSLGYIPMNIYINEQDRDIDPHNTDVFTDTLNISSSVIIGKLSELEDKGFLTDIYGQIRVHINKPIEYWYDTNANIIEKAKKMIEEFDTFL